MILAACGSEDPAGFVDPLASLDAAVIDAGSTASDGSTPSVDGGVAPDGGATDGGDPSGSDAATAPGGDGGPADAGDPLLQPLEEFCRGSGGAVRIGTTSQCLDELATQTFRYGLCVCDDLAVDAQLSLDAFDSTTGPYGGANVLADGHLGLERAALALDGRLLARGSVFVGGPGFSVGPTSRVEGSLYARGTARQENAATTIGRNAFVDGDVLGRFTIGGDLQVPRGAGVDGTVRVSGQLRRAPVPAIAPCGCDAAQRVDVTGVTAWAARHNDNASLAGFDARAWASGGGPSVLRLPCGRYWVSNIQHQGGLRIVAEGRVVLFVDGDLVAESGLDVGLAPDAEMDLFVAGDLRVQGAVTFGSTTAPARFRTYVGGGGAIDLSSAARFGGNLYAPSAPVRFGASARLYGSAFVGSAEFPASATIHYDRAIRAEGEVCVTPDGGVADGGPGDAAPDAGGGGDAGGAPDGGVGLDAGPSPDAGGGGLDSGDPDPGNVGCSRCGSCGELACVPDPAGGPNVCGACVSDLDCCAPALCTRGRCSTGL